MSFLNITPKTVLGGLQHAKKIDMKAEVWHVSIPMTVLGGLQLMKKVEIKLFNKLVSIPMTVLGGLQLYSFYHASNKTSFQYR